jgi:ADP-heptose:LPS heptosyltransferase
MVNYRMKKVLILPLYGIGDVLMTTPSLRNLGEQGGFEITYLHMFRTTYEILLNNPNVKENIFFPFLTSARFQGIRFLLQFRGKFDYSINFYPSNRRDYSLAALIAGSPVRIGHRYMVGDLAGLNFLKNRTVREDDGIHNVEENLRLLGFLGVEERRPYPMEIFLTPEEISFADRWLRDRAIEAERFLTGVHPGTSVFKGHEKRRWDEAKYASLLDTLAASVGDGIFLLFGGPEEKPLRDTIVSLVGDAKRVVPVDSVSVREAAALMKRCKLFISNDSGPMHMAAAERVPTVALFGPTNPAWVRPWGVEHRVIRTCIACSPCFRYSPRPLQCVAGRDFACLRDISVQEVYDACMELIRM